jgi:dienelactone hydrolase
MALNREPEEFSTTFQYYQHGQFKQGFDLLESVKNSYPEYMRRIYEWQVCLAAKMDQFDLAESLLQKALDAGYFYTEFFFRQESDLAGLQGRPLFETLVQRSAAMQAEAQAQTAPDRVVLEPLETTASTLPYLMALHGNNGNAGTVHDYWAHLTEEGWLVTLPQSSQVGGNNLFVWNDQGKAETELRAHYDFLAAKYKLDPRRALISGFSMGGHAAILTALTQVVPVRGFIGVASYTGEMSAFEKEFEKGAAAGLRGYFLLGENDELCTKSAVALSEGLNKAGIACDVEVFPGIAHEFPVEYRAAIDRAIRFIFQE